MLDIQRLNIKEMKLKSQFILFFFTGGVTRTLTVLMPFIAIDLGLSLGEVGFAKSVFSIAKIFLMAPIIMIANKYNNKKLIYLAVIIYSITILLSGFSPSYLILITLYVIASLGFALYSPIAKSEVISAATNDTRGKMVSNYSSTGELGGLVLSTIFGFIAVASGWRWTSILLGILPMLVLIYIIRQERKDPKPEVELAQTKRLPLKSLLKNKKLIYALLCSLFDNIASASVLLFVPFLLIYYKYGEVYIPIITAFAMGGSFIGKYFSGRLSDKFSTSKVFVISEILMALILIIMALSSNIIVLLIASLILGIVTKGTVPIYQVMVADSVENSEIKSTTAMEITTNNTGTIISGVLFGLIGDQFGTPAIFIGLGMAALIAAIPGILYARTKKH